MSATLEEKLRELVKGRIMLNEYEGWELGEEDLSFIATQSARIVLEHAAEVIEANWGDCDYPTNRTIAGISEDINETIRALAASLGGGK
jgi:hypothetical protein